MGPLESREDGAGQADVQLPGALPGIAPPAVEMSGGCNMGGAQQPWPGLFALLIAVLAVSRRRRFD